VSAQLTKEMAMTQLESSTPETAKETTQTVDSASSDSPSTHPATNPSEATTPMTQAQAEAMLTELKSIKKNVFLLLLVAGFFALRHLLFHY
jgi:hypothetical protein